MTTKTISLNTIVDVKEFVNTVARYDFEVDLGFRQISHRWQIHHGHFQLGSFQTD